MIKLILTYTVTMISILTGFMYSIGIDTLISLIK